jgi:hypothetical protein
VTFLGLAYLRRKQFESRLQANALLKAMGEAMGRRERVAPEAMMAMLGGF